MADEEDTAPEQSEAEVKAREQGWLPKEEFKGKAELWKPAEEWLERSGSRYVPALEKKIGQLERKLAEKEANTEAAIKRLEGTMKAHYQVQIDAIKEEYEQRKRKAVETGDTDAYDKAAQGETKALATLEKKVEVAEERQDDRKQAKTNSDLPPEVVKRLETWLEDNDWYFKDRRLGRKFDLTYYDVEDDPNFKTATIAERLDETKARLKKANPVAFGGEPEEEEDEEPARRSRVEGGSRGANGGSRKKGWTDIDAEDRRMAQSMIGEGKLFKDKADYAADYWKAQEEEARV